MLRFFQILILLLVSLWALKPTEAVAFFEKGKDVNFEKSADVYRGELNLGSIGARGPPEYSYVLASKSLVAAKTNVASSVNDAAALKSKLKGLQNAQNSAVSTRNLPDGRVRYYGAEKAAAKAGNTRGASLVTEFNPRNNQVRQWMEAYDQSGKVNRVHPKMLNGQQLNSPHSPPTAAELGL